MNVSAGEQAVFVCRVNVSPAHVVWYLDETPLQYLVDVDAKDYLCLECLPITSTLSIFVSLEHTTSLNNSLVHCLVINKNYSDNEKSSPALLTVQGEQTFNVIYAHI